MYHTDRSVVQCRNSLLAEDLLEAVNVAVVRVDENDRGYRYSMAAGTSHPVVTVLQCFPMNQ